VTYSLESQSYESWTNFGFSPVWLNDNESLLFVSHSKLFLADKAKRVRELLSVAPHQLSDVSISRDNRKIAVSRMVTEADIWLATLK
jgi:hypothetical protein